MKPSNDLNKIISKLPAVYPGRASLNKLLECFGIKSKKDTLAIQRLAESISQNTEIQAYFIKESNRVVNNWINILLGRRSFYLKQERSIKQAAKRKAVEAKRQKTSEQTAEKKIALFKQLNLTDAQKKILRQLAD